MDGWGYEYQLVAEVESRIWWCSECGDDDKVLCFGIWTVDLGWEYIVMMMMMIR